MEVPVFPARFRQRTCVTGCSRRQLPPTTMKQPRYSLLAQKLQPRFPADALKQYCAKPDMARENLAVQMDAVLKEADRTKAIPTGLSHDARPHSQLRKFSRAHPINDQTTLQIIDVEAHEAEYCLDVLDALFDHHYVKPAEARRRKEALDAKLKAAGKPPSK